MYCRLQKRSLFVTILADIIIGCFVLWNIRDIYQPVEPLLDGAEVNIFTLYLNFECDFIYVDFVVYCDVST